MGEVDDFRCRSNSTKSHHALGGKLDQPELLQRGDTVVEPDFLGDLAVLQLQNSRTGKTHFPAGVRGQGAGQEVAERGAGVRPTAFPTADHIVGLRDEIGGAPEIEIGKGLAEIRHESLDVLPSPTWL